ncbi:hypothetical protein DFH08DRAFT_1083764 [Mycena albidolilacea]|uniref:Uncharacterized protein n=1 Tax=Mycena albidolilacea TaxID=1033008 RepID=A0AAD6ZPS5_9AGAR|nr:hypothetical protein DFH08DRAFT_1083764 [Mycena albidolilacea]
MPCAFDDRSMSSASFLVNFRSRTSADTTLDLPAYKHTYLARDRMLNPGRRAVGRWSTLPPSVVHGLADRNPRCASIALRAVVVDAPDAYACFRDPYCALRREWAWGIPIWKILSFHYWDDTDHPLGRKWTLSPEPYLPCAPPQPPPATAPTWATACSPSAPSSPSSRTPSAPPPSPPPETRRKQIYIYAKTADDFSPEKGAFPPHIFARLPAALGVDFVVGVQGADAVAALPAGVANLGGLGGMGLARFLEALARSWVLVGMGAPSTLLTPYDALCLGVPFINPILTWDPAHPDDRSRWAAQREGLKHLGPPHVYNVFKDDADGLGAGRAPSGSLGAVQARVDAALETDWRGAAEAVLAARVQATAEKGGESGEETADETLF